MQGGGEGAGAAAAESPVMATVAAHDGGGVSGGVPHPTLILGLTGDSDVEAMRAAGCNTVLSKPVQPTAVTVVISRWDAAAWAVWRRLVEASEALRHRQLRRVSESCPGGVQQGGA